MTWVTYNNKKLDNYDDTNDHDNDIDDDDDISIQWHASSGHNRS